jgi:L-fuculose-phosphate aldolase
LLDEQTARIALVEAGRQMVERQLLFSIEGNLSMRLPGDMLLTTPSGAHKGRLAPSELVLCDLEGTVHGSGRPSSELPMHLAVMQERPDVGALVHAHPPYATGWAVAGRELPQAALAESLALFGCVPLAPYATPSTDCLAASVRDALRDFDVALLANHGAVAAGGDLQEAVERMTQLEHLSRIAFVAESLGGAKALEAAQIDSLSKLLQQQGGRPIPAVCYPSESESGTITLTRAELVRLIADAARAVR